MLTLATRLRGMDDARLRRAIELRGIQPNGIRDFFDLAEAFLDADSLQRTLAHLDRHTLALLALAGESTSVADRAAGEEAPTLGELARRLSQARGQGGADAGLVTVADVAERAALLDSLLLAALIDDRLSPYDGVTAQLQAWPAQGLPGAAALASEPAPSALPQVSTEEVRVTDGLAAERAFAAVSSIAELVNEVAREPARELSRGGLGLPDSKRLAAAMSVDLESVGDHVAIAARAGLVGRETGHWIETEAGVSWLQRPTNERWGVLADSWQAALPVDVRRILSDRPGLSWGDGLRSFVTWLYPAGGSWMDEQIRIFTRDAELLGISAHQTTSTAGAAALAGDIDAAVATMRGVLPREVGQVYLQHDLTIVSPGPLSPAIDARLRSLADVESRELASSYRISATSVNRALAAGETAESLLEFLRGISLTGVPQPLNYLVQEAAARYGRVRVGHAATSEHPNRTYVRSDDPALLGTIAVDQTLASLGLVPAANGRLVSRFAPDAVFWALTDARYPAAAENETGEIVHLRRHTVAQPAPAAQSDAAGALIEKIRAADGGESEAPHAWLARQLDVAIRTKQTLTVSIATPGGAVVDYLLEPASIGGGRFRARDRRADIERTLPLSSIVRITPAP
jgi:hypothetical protein